MKDILQSYLRRLTNLTGSNRSLVLLRLISDQTIDLHDTNYELNEPSFKIIDSLISQESKIPLCSVADSRDTSANRLSWRLKKLQRIEKFIEDERGARDLYIGWPFIRGKLSDGTLIRSPLMFFPVSIQAENNTWYLFPRKDVNLTLNKSFLLAYSYFNQVELDESLLERTFDDFETDSRVFRTSLYQLLKESPVEVNFNQENFIDELIPFQNFKKSEFEEKHDNGELKLFPEAVLGIFPQASSYLVPDYVHLLENTDIQDIEEFFARKNNTEINKVNSDHNPYRFLKKVEEEKTFTPFALDAYQENALKAVKQGCSIVVQGPPGTGKSQLICNIIADAMANRKKILVVSQKKAALDVVYNRLKQKDLERFSGLVHDFKNDRKSLYERVNSQIESLQEYKIKNNSLDALQLERKFIQTSRKIDQISEDMEEFKFALFDESEAGISVKELYLTSSLKQPSIHLKQEYTYFKINEIEPFLRKLKNYASYAHSFSHDNYPWHDRRDFKDFGIAELRTILEVIDAIKDFDESLSERSETIIGTPISRITAEAILEKKESLLEMIDLLQSPKVYSDFRGMVDFHDSETDLLWLSNTERTLLSCFDGEPPETSLHSQDLGRFQEALESRMQAQRTFWSWIRWKLTSKEKLFIKRVLIANKLKNNRSGFNQLVERIDARLNLEHNITKLRSNDWLKNIPIHYKRDHFVKWFEYVKKAVKAKLIFTSVRNFKEFFNVHKLTFEELKERLNAFLEICEEIPDKKAHWSQYLTIPQINAVTEYPNKVERMVETLHSDFDTLCDYDRLRASLLEYEKVVIARLIDEAERTEDVEELFQNSLRLAWIDHMETKFPILRSISSQRFEQLEEELQEAVALKEEISNDITLIRARELTYQDLEYNRLNNLVTYRDLQHQVTKKKRIWPLRKLIDNFQEELFQLLPCWLASPETVSAIFPMKEVFDLIIFDEASQCFVEKGIPAMYRGKQVIVVGDDKQLQPFDLYRVRWEEEDDITPELEIDSLLSLADRNLMNLQLKGHYRSRSLDLIDFSNRFFYQGQLTLLPDRDIVNGHEPAISYVKVDGVWENQQNDIEAQKVVEILKDLADKEALKNKEVGVVTFNAVQQGHILDGIEEEQANGLSFPFSLMVKNIENIQGDESDIIIFSTAYAPDKEGKLRVQFGNLNQERGENRLNVAVTRAREKIYLVTSIWPDQLDVDNTKNAGPKLLKEYLKYAREVTESKFVPSPAPAEPHTHSWYLRHQLKGLGSNWPGIELREVLPFADLTVHKAGFYSGLVLTDDHLYHQSISVKDAHVYTPATFSSKNWRMRRFFSREWWHDPENVTDRLMKFAATD